MGAIDPNTGIYIYDEADSQPTFSGLLNLAQNNTKAAVAGLQAIVAAQSALSRNFAFNANAAINQRNAASYTTTGYTFDRWHATISNTTVSRAAVAETDTLFHNAFVFRHTATNSSNSCVMRQGFTSDDVALMRGETLTFSMPVRSSSTGVSVTIAVERSATADTVTSGTWTTINSVTVTPGTTGLMASVTAAIPQNTTARGLRISVSTLNMPNTVTMDYGDIMLERGLTRSFYRLRNLTAAAELLDCQRFAYVPDQTSNYGGAASNSTVAQARFAFPATMRATPGVSILTAGSWIIGNDHSANYTAANVGINNANLTAKGGRVGLSGFSGLATAAYHAGTDVTGTAQIIFQAEIS